MGVVQARCAGLDVHTRRRAFAQRDESGLLLAGATNPASQERQHRSPRDHPGHVRKYYQEGQRKCRAHRQKRDGDVTQVLQGEEDNDDDEEDNQCRVDVTHNLSPFGAPAFRASANGRQPRENYRIPVSPSKQESFSEAAARAAAVPPSFALAVDGDTVRRATVSASWLLGCFASIGSEPPATIPEPERARESGAAGRPESGRETLIRSRPPAPQP